MWPEGSKNITEVSRRPVTAGYLFKTSMNDLIENLKQKVPFYIRCIKPNSDKSPSKFDPAIISHQVEYLGLVENVRVRRAGFAHRSTYERFYQRYKMISPLTWPNFRDGNVEQASRTLINDKHFGSDVEYGKTKIFIRSPQTVVELERQRERYIGMIIVLLQKVWRGTLVRMRIRRLRAAMYILQAYRRYKLRQYLSELHSLAVQTRQLYQPGYSSSSTRMTPTQQRLSLERNGWPKEPRALISVVSVLRRIHRRWKAWLLLRRIPREQWNEFRLKIIATSALSGRRLNYGLADKWLGNYLALQETNMKANQFKSEVRQFLPNETVLFSSRVIKASSSFLRKCVDRWIVVTERTIYRIDWKTSKLVGHATPIMDATGIAITKGVDQLVAVNVRGGNDFVVAFVDSNDPYIRPVNRVGEFVAIILKQYSLLTKRDLMITISDSIHCRLGNKEKVLMVEPSGGQHPIQVLFKRNGNHLSLLWPSTLQQQQQQQHSNGL
ncbi:hypothetical protein BLA29_004781 [Euroglyphus maynei]|uniref:Uncharacterized protein n=1 Tax=Euroglyphus maynei TaxID=6958 RepID=A0A1Y3B7F4_EURMA|nr:hypothetical protein BLA29_004781 [Euroglyphus maynei]